MSSQQLVSIHFTNLISQSRIRDFKTETVENLRGCSVLEWNLKILTKILKRHQTSVLRVNVDDVNLNFEADSMGHVFQAKFLENKTNLLTSSLIWPSYQMRATIYKRCFSLFNNSQNSILTCFKNNKCVMKEL